MEKITVSKKKSPKKKVIPKPAKAPKPKQEAMFDTALPALEKLAEDYAEARDQRQEYLNQEVQIKGELLAEMHAQHKTDYVRGNVEIHVVMEEETVRVKIKKESPDAEKK